MANHPGGSLLDKYGVKVLGTSIRTLELSEDRDLFAKALEEIDIPIAKSIAVSSVDEALEAAERVQYPVIIRAGRLRLCEMLHVRCSLKGSPFSPPTW